MDSRQYFVNSPSAAKKAGHELPRTSTAPWHEHQKPPIASQRLETRYGREAAIHSGQRCNDSRCRLRCPSDLGGANQRTAREKEASLGWKAQVTKRAKWRSSTSIGRREQTLLGAEDVGRLGSRPSGPRPGFVAVHSLL